MLCQTRLCMPSAKNFYKHNWGASFINIFLGRAAVIRLMIR